MSPKIGKFVCCVALGLALGVLAPMAFADKIDPTPTPGTDPPSICDGISGNLVANCGFETGTFADWTLGSNTSYFGVSGEYAHSGNYGAYLGAVVASFSGGNQLSQALTTTAGDDYTLTYWLENIGGPENGFEALWNGSVIASSEFTNAAPFQWTEYTFSGLAATGSSTTLQFNAYQLPSYFGLDDISVVQSTSAIPEPSSLLLLGTGLLGILGTVRRKLSA